MDSPQIIQLLMEYYFLFKCLFSCWIISMKPYLLYANYIFLIHTEGFPGGSTSAYNTGNMRDVGLIPGSEDPEEGMVTHSSILACRIPWTEEPGGLQSIGSQRVEHNWGDLACAHTINILFFISSQMFDKISPSCRHLSMMLFHLICI